MLQHFHVLVFFVSCTFSLGLVVILDDHPNKRASALEIAADPKY
jgi:hypothetical protein